MDNIQTNTRAGNVAFASGDLSAKNGYLAKLTSTGVALPAALTDDTPYVIVDGGTSETVVKPLNRGEQIRVMLKGTCSQGDLLCAADPTTAADAGKVRAVPTAAGTYKVIGIAEESGVDAQAVLVRAFDKSVTVAASQG
jgi:hypothetical protein